MKLHEMKQKRNTIAKDMRALHDNIGDSPWTDEQRTQWNAAKSELDSLDERIAREEERAARIRTISTKTSRNSASSRIVIQQTRKHRLTNVVLRRLMRFAPWSWRDER